MQDYFKIKTWFITIIMFIIAFGLSSAIVYYEFGFRKNIRISRASSSDNVTGWAWNSNIGWVSFNSTNETAPVYDYGVKINKTTGFFSGYAWSPSVGWISFNRKTCTYLLSATDTGAYCTTNSECSSDHCLLNGPGAAGAPPGSNPAANIDYNAIYDFSTEVVTGWAKILSMGDDGWIEFNDTWTNGVKISQTNGDLNGWAWNANNNISTQQGIGWLSFNCNDVPKTCSGGTNNGTPCPTGTECLGGGSCVDTCTNLSNYKVNADINRPPSAINLTAPNLSNYQAGQLGALMVEVAWNFSDPDLGQSKHAYQVIVDDSDPASPSPLLDTGQCTGYLPSPSNCIIDVTVDQFTVNLAPAITLNYNTSYYWWVKVWDNHPNNEPSALAQYSTNPDTDNDDRVGSPLVNNNTFTTYKHEMPNAGFTNFPLAPSQDEEVSFTNISEVYLSGPPPTPSTAVNCSTLAIGQCIYLWTATGATINDTSTTSPIIIFTSPNSSTVTLRVTDTDGYYNEYSVVYNINSQLPKWKEVKPD